jgi:hypothetical protein
LLKIHRIESDKLNINQLKAMFKDHKSLNTDDIASFYRLLDPAIKATTINWRIYTLVKNGALTRIGRGTYLLGEGKKYTPDISKRLKYIGVKLQKEFPYLNICIWSTSFYNEFMLHQPGRFFILVEVERDASEAVFHFLKELKFNAYLAPNKEILERYTADDKETIIVKTLISEAPLQRILGIKTVTLEKMIVDMLSDSIIHSAQQGSELNQIINEATQKYAVNLSRILRYANRRNQKEQLTDLLCLSKNHKSHKK